MIKSDKNQRLLQKLKIKLKIWLKNYILIPDQESSTPYIHILCFHIPEFIEIYGNMNLFSMQGLENLNSFSKLNYFILKQIHCLNFMMTIHLVIQILNTPIQIKSRQPKSDI